MPSLVSVATWDFSQIPPVFLTQAHMQEGVCLDVTRISLGSSLGTRILSLSAVPGSSAWWVLTMRRGTVFHLMCLPEDFSLCVFAVSSGSCESMLPYSKWSELFSNMNYAFVQFCFSQTHMEWLSSAQNSCSHQVSQVHGHHFNASWFPAVEHFRFPQHDIVPDESDISLSAASPLILLFLVVTNESKYCLTQQVIIVRNALSREVVLGRYKNAIWEGSGQVDEGQNWEWQGGKWRLTSACSPGSCPLELSWAIACDLGIWPSSGVLLSQQIQDSEESPPRCWVSRHLMLWCFLPCLLQGCIFHCSLLSLFQGSAPGAPKP